MKNKTLGSVPNSYICGNLDNSQTSFILTLGQIPVLYILGFRDKSQNYQNKLKSLKVAQVKDEMDDDEDDGCDVVLCCDVVCGGVSGGKCCGKVK